MFLSDILKYTPKESIEQEDLMESLKTIEEITGKINEKKKILENESFKKELSQSLKGKYNISIELDRELLREYNLKLSFPDLNIFDEPYRIMILTDMIILTETKSKKKLIFFFTFMKIIEINRNDSKLILEILYNNIKSIISFTIPLLVDLDDISENISNQIDDQNLNLLTNGVISDDFLLEGYNRALTMTNLNIANQNFAISEEILKQTSKNMIKINSSYNNTLKKIDETYQLYLDLKKKAEDEKTNLNKIEKEYQKYFKNSEKIHEKINDLVEKSIEFDEKFKLVHKEEDAYKQCFGDYPPSKIFLKSYVPELSSFNSDKDSNSDVSKKDNLSIEINSNDYNSPKSPKLDPNEKKNSKLNIFKNKISINSDIKEKRKSFNQLFLYKKN
jgi:hypothetical protein